MNSELENLFIHAFVAAERRERWRSLLPTEKGRGKLLDRLAHEFRQDLDSRFVYEKESPPSNIAVAVEKLMSSWKAQNPQLACYILANNDEVDGTLMRLADAEKDLRLTFGAVIILIPNRLAYYHPERSNLSKESYYLLYHP